MLSHSTFLNVLGITFFFFFLNVWKYLADPGHPPQTAKKKGCTDMRKVITDEH